jgi:hypothetical protein
MEGWKAEYRARQSKLLLMLAKRPSIVRDGHGTTRNSHIILNNLGWPARARQVTIPDLGDRPALDPHDCGRKTNHKIDRDDDEPDEPRHPPAARQTQEGEAEGRLAPCCSQKGRGEAEGRLAPCCSQKGREARGDGDPGSGRHFRPVHVLEVQADAVLGAFGEQC